MKKLSWVRRFYLLFTLLICLLFVLTSTAGAKQKDADQAPGRTMARQATKAKEIWITVDHATHKALQKEFKSGAEVTNTCLSCHSEAGSQFRKTIHWTWLGSSADSEKRSGKAGDSLNNFCISTNNMQDKSCSACHTGWNAKDGGINCLVCHSQEKEQINWTEAFEDFQAFSGSDDPEDLELAKEIQDSIQKSVQSIGRPTRKNCGSCHFYGGGGDGVKHGDLDSSITKPNKALDVHMGLDGQKFECVRCHTTVLHNVAGRIYSKPAATDRKSLIEDDLTPKIMCESCHSAKPHKSGSKANDHTDKVACQSCHIPEYARVNPTKMWWDWSKAGKKKNGKPYKTKDSLGKYDYMSHKGEMKWAKNVKPEYFWFNGSINTLTVKDVIDPHNVVQVSAPVGSREDINSRIFPFKVHRGKQPYDKVHKTLLAPLLSGKDGYWNTFDWQRALTKGMQSFDLPFSGQFDYVETSYVFPTTHMVAPKENVVNCIECHSRENGRLANLSGFYMPGRDSFKLMNIFGWAAIIVSLCGVVLHGLGRVFTNGRRGGK
ncbi:MAG: tetrathionate reductase family octaheme c-type cytochrome [Desulfobacterales bacterium]|uniref:Tetrathionate reductase family octaheme c-type cytochrome n=1 Tax=Candidatus Desulfatibia vada TaxID=2841696 RepID=A0A8J6TQZ8_9BACT|nr:tetrathionate reductase family octaheme c-type cytochrome [Candidatus Desulfatibia vada]MBL6970592.1 tetrathionate reductase family octaheme c-type cytochrome [Desulfobacterales bacterium]